MAQSLDETLFWGYDIHPQFTLRTSSEIKNRVLRTSSEIKIEFWGRPQKFDFYILRTATLFLFFGGAASQYIGLSVCLFVCLPVCQFQLPLSSKMTESTNSTSTTTFVVLVNSVNDKVTWSITFRHINILNLFQGSWLCKIHGQDEQIFQEIVMILNIICITGQLTE